jgi:hypothetical protein
VKQAVNMRAGSDSPAATGDFTSYLWLLSGAGHGRENIVGIADDQSDGPDRLVTKNSSTTVVC